MFVANSTLCFQSSLRTLANAPRAVSEEKGNIHLPCLWYKGRLVLNVYLLINNKAKIELGQKSRMLLSNTQGIIKTKIYLLLKRQFQVHTINKICFR
jgi:hypothetical protein